MVLFIKKHLNAIILLSLAAFFFFMIGVGVVLQKRSELKADFRLAGSAGEKKWAHPGKDDLQASDSSSANGTAFFLKPSPEELIAQISDLDFADVRVATRKFSGLMVMWPLYFFSFEKNEENGAIARFDASEDGFGVMVYCTVDKDEFLQVADLERGHKAWIGGEIVKVDPSGTGTIYLKMEQLAFSAPPVFSSQ